MTGNLNLILSSFVTVFRPANFFFMFFGVVEGVVIGALPGLSGSIGIILLLPLVYRLESEIALVMLCGVFCGSMFGGSVSAILLNTRGYGEEFNLHHQGGPIGYAGRDYRVDFSTPGVIQENQAFCWNPSITGTKSEDTVIVSSKGVLPVSRPIICPTITLQVNGQTFVRPNIWECC